MSTKREYDLFDMDQGLEQDDQDDQDILKIMQSRKIRKTRKDQMIGFCDNCNCMTAVKVDSEFPQFSYCIDCEIDVMTDCTEFLTVKTDGPRFEQTDQSPPGSDAKPKCPGCMSPFQPNQLAHMEPGGCLYTEE